MRLLLFFTPGTNFSEAAASTSPETRLRVRTYSAPLPQGRRKSGRQSPLTWEVYFNKAIGYKGLEEALCG